MALPAAVSRAVRSVTAGTASRRQPFRSGLTGLITILVLASATASTTQVAVPSPPTFKSGVENVEVDVVVTTRKSQVVRDLAEGDFHVFEDGKPQPLTAFARVDIPIEAHQKGPVRAPFTESDVTTNEHAAEGRVYVLLMDELHISDRSVSSAKSAADAFINRLGPNDLMAVVHTAGPDTASQEFTSSQRRLVTAVDQTTAHGLQTANAVRNETAIASGGRRIGDLYDLERAQNAESALRALHDVSTWFGTVRGRRKAILFVSEGIDYPMSMIDRPTELNSPWDVVMHDAREAVDAAMRSNVGVYVIDPNRLRGVDDIANEYFDPNNPSLGPRGAQRELSANQDNSRWLAEQTGGIAIVGRSDLDRAFDAIVADNSTYYVLAYVPPNHKQDGKFHKITVRVDRPGVVIRTRSGYLAQKSDAPAVQSGGPSRELREALATPLPLAGLPIRVSVAPFKGSTPNASVLMTADLAGRDLKLDSPNTLEMSYVAIDVAGKARAVSDDRIQLATPNADSRARIERSGLRVFNRLNLPPGRYSVKIAAHDQAGGTTGSIGYDLDVPDFDAAPVSVSGLVLTALGTGRMVVVKADPQTSQVLPAPPITERSFSQDEQVWLYAEVYDNLGDVPHTTTITTTLTSDGGAVAWSAASDHGASELHGQHGTFRYRIRMPLADVVPGPYQLTIEARTRGGRNEIATRGVPITVLAAQQK